MQNKPSSPGSKERTEAPPAKFDPFDIATQHLRNQLARLDAFTPGFEQQAQVTEKLLDFSRVCSAEIGRDMPSYIVLSGSSPEQTGRVARRRKDSAAKQPFIFRAFVPEREEFYMVYKQGEILEIAERSLDPRLQDTFVGFATVDTIISGHKNYEEEHPDNSTERRAYLENHTVKPFVGFGSDLMVTILPLRDGERRLAVEDIKDIASFFVGTPQPGEQNAAIAEARGNLDLSIHQYDQLVAKAIEDQHESVSGVVRDFINVFIRQRGREKLPESIQLREDHNTKSAICFLPKENGRICLVQKRRPKTWFDRHGFLPDELDMATAEDVPPAVYREFALIAVNRLRNYTS